MEPVFYPRTFLALFFGKASFALSDFVCMMDRNVIDSACVDVDVLPEIFHAHCRAFDVPAWIAAAPWRIPGHCLILKLRLCEPEYEVAGIALVLVDYDFLALAFARDEFFKVKIRKLAVIRVGRDVVVKVSASHVSVTVCLKLFDKLNHFVDMLCGLADYVRVTDIEGIDVLHESVGVIFCHFKDALVSFFGSFEHFVVAVVAVACEVADIRDVHYMLDVVAQEFERFVEDVKENIGTEIADMRIIVNRRTTAVKTDMIFMYRHEILHSASHCVKKS